VRCSVVCEAVKYGLCGRVGKTTSTLARHPVVRAARAAILPAIRPIGKDNVGFPPFAASFSGNIWPNHQAPIAHLPRHFPRFPPFFVLFFPLHAIGERSYVGG